MGPIICRERSVRNYHYRLRNTPEERRSQAHIISLSASPSTATECLWYWGHPYVEPRLSLTVHTPDINASKIKSRPFPLVKQSTPCCCQVYCCRPRFAFFPNLLSIGSSGITFSFWLKNYEFCYILTAYLSERHVIILVESLNRSTKPFNPHQNCGQPR